jgi:Xaa-Pro aminopeptidase
MTTREKLDVLRRFMRERGLAAYLVPSTDPHQSEYVPECWQRRGWLSGFSGSAGELVVTGQEAGLWTDGRYFLQAEAELRGSGIRLRKAGQPKVPSLRDYLAQTLQPGEALGVDPQLLSVAAYRRLAEALRPGGARIQPVSENLVDLLWTDRPAPSFEPIRLLPPTYSGETATSKLRRLREQMKKKGAEAHLSTALDAVAWLFNIRGRDMSFNPVAIAYALVTSKDAFLFIQLEKVPPDALKKLSPQVTVRPYGALRDALGELAAAKSRVWCDEDSTSQWAADLLADCRLISEPSPILVMKSKKNEVECAGIRAAGRRDGVALVRFLHWLEIAVAKGEVTEISAAAALEGFRREGERYQGPSFSTISSYGPHGAVIHYSPSPKTDLPLKPEGIYLIDSGGQYLDGTTDTTRTVLLGKTATKEQKDRFTRVLRGHMALAGIRFPVGVQGIRLDTLARLALWEKGEDYNHGTGHGIGHYLCVHEGPQSISSARCPTPPLEPGNVLSNEPGFYKAGEYGMRVENSILVVEDKTLSGEGKLFLAFETLTLCPIDTRLVEVKLLSPTERRWLNEYHRRVLKELSPLLGPQDRTWLKKACAPI